MRLCEVVIHPFIHLTSPCWYLFYTKYVAIAFKGSDLRKAIIKILYTKCCLNREEVVAICTWERQGDLKENHILIGSKRKRSCPGGME